MDFRKAFERLFDPKKVEGYFVEELPKAHWKQVLFNLAIYAVIYLVFTIFNILVMALSSQTIGTTSASVIFSAAAIGMVAFTAALGMVLLLISFFIRTGILHIVSRVFGAKGRYLDLVYLSSIVGVIVLLLGQVIGLVASFPIISCIALIFLLGLMIYNLYVDFKMVKVVYRVDETKAIMIVAANLIVQILIAVILIVLLYIFVLGAIMGSALGGSSSLLQPY